ncbi:hypothetical protein BAL199_19261 [alpha proteobacterium BAL199]|nr:hypothetical protein BAL199_19261 [alpha proteobacterium BAL199]
MLAAGLYLPQLSLARRAAGRWL